MPQQQLRLNLPPSTGGASRLLKIRLTGNPSASLKRVAIALRASRQRINLAIAQEIARITRSNFGPSGPMRPFPWPPYSKRYARKHPGPPTLIRSGFLLSSISASATNSGGLVTAEGSRNYAAAQQFGYPRRNLPARPYFPILSRNGATVVLTVDAQKSVQAVFDKEIQRIINIK